MRYCTNCGNQLEENSFFCQECGHKLEEPYVSGNNNNSIVESKKREIKIDSQKLILTLGVFLVLFASFIFGFITWNSMSPTIRLLFFIFEGLLFFGISLVFGKVNNNMSRLFAILGFLMIPYVLSLVPYYDLTSEFIKSGQGLYVYLALCYLITFIVFALSNIKFKSIVITILSFLFLLASFVFFALAISESLSIVLLFVIIYLLILELFSIFKIFGDKISIIIFYFAMISTYVCMPLLIISYYEFDKDIIINLISTITFIITTFIHLFNNKKSVFGFISPIFLPILYCCFFGSIANGDILCFHLIATISITVYLLFSFINNETKTISMAFTYIQLILLPFILLVSSDINHLTYIQDITILLTILLGFNFIELLVNKNKTIAYFIPANIFLLILSFFEMVTDFDFKIVILFICISFILIYVILKIFKNEISKTYLYTACIMCFVSLLNSAGGINLINILVPIIYGIIFVLTIVFKENKLIKIPTYILFNIGLIVLFKDLEILYSIMIISSVTLITTLLLSNNSKSDFKPYILYSEILIIFSIAINNFKNPIFISILLFLLYILGLYSVIKYYNYKAYRIFYIIFGLIFIINFITFLIEPVLVSSLVSIAAILVVLTVLYLLDIEEPFSIGLLSLSCLVPYYNIVINEFNSISELYACPIILYTIILTRTYKFNNDYEKKIATLVPMFLTMYLFTSFAFFDLKSTTSMIFDLLLATIFIIVGLIRKYNSLTISGIAIIVLTLFIRLFMILNNVALVIVLIIIGFVLIGLSLFIELRKKKE